MIKKFTKIKNKPLFIFLLGILLLLFVVLLTQLFFLNKFYPGLSIAGENIALLTKAEATQKISDTIHSRLDKKIELTYSEGSSSAKQFELDLSNLQLETNLDEKINLVFQFGHSNLYLPPNSLQLDINFNLDQLVSKIEPEVNKKPTDSKLLVKAAEVTVTPSQNGTQLDKLKLKKLIQNYLNTGNLTENNLPVKTIYPDLSYNQALNIKNSLEQIKLEPLKLTFKEKTFQLTLNDALSLIDIKSSKPQLLATNFNDNPFVVESITIGDKEYGASQVVFDQEKISNYLQTIARDLDQEVKEPIFNYKDNKVADFQPPQEGRKLNTQKAQKLISQSLLNSQKKEIILPVETLAPKNKLSNELGIKELIGQGISNFAGSIPNRIYNVNLTASKLNGALIPPGETFSFINTVGDISAQSGFKQAYVIKSGRTVLDDGGGVCQDSTTLYRAVLNAGLPVIKRTAHAYRVGYYEQGFPPGLDATIFNPSVDFQFKNDTGHHILIQAYTEGLTLYVDLYGTSDGRISKLTQPIITNQTPPPPELRQDDPTLPKGTVKQVDFPAWGATVVFSRTVTRGGETLINETIRSNYKPWQAIYLVGTQ